MPWVRHSLSASDLGDVAKREPGHFHETPERYLLDLGEDVAFERAEVDELSVGGFPISDLALAV